MLLIFCPSRLSGAEDDRTSEASALSRDPGRRRTRYMGVYPEIPEGVAVLGSSMVSETFVRAARPR